jgi:NAD(P)-dependent dehydrogenase (short-subunit alcohol dehydrogenase family)
VASRLRDRAGPIDLLVNNAGVYRARRELSEDGFEMTMAGLLTTWAISS